MVSATELQSVLDFWFGTLQRSDWFASNERVDLAFAARFMPLFEAVSADDAAMSFDTADAALAAILLLDQFPRNVFRGQPRAFATDARAVALTKDMLARHLDAHVPPDRRVFAYLPLEHSENVHDQTLSVELISAIGDAEYTRYAIAHRDVIARFGRFPHRNKILGRTSTPEELAYLAEPGSGF